VRDRTPRYENLVARGYFGPCSVPLIDMRNSHWFAKPPATGRSVHITPIGPLLCSGRKNLKGPFGGEF
jgi:hypothetical protein